MRKVTAPAVLALVALYCASAAGQVPGPVISDLRVEPSSGPPGSAYTISVRIESPRDPDAIVPILNEIRENMEKIQVNINDDGLAGDAIKGDGRYTGRIAVPPSAAQQTHHFRVYILDIAGRMSNVLEYDFSVLKDATT